MPKIPQPEFWTNEEKMLWRVMFPSLMKLLEAGGKSGAGQLPGAVRIFVDWDVFNQDVIDYLRQYRLSWVQGTHEYTREQAIQNIEEWIQNGEALPLLEQRLAPLFSSVRARRIAVTEVTRIYAKGNSLAWKSSGLVTAKKWQTAKDERVCPLCGPLHNKIVSIDDVFIQGIDEIAESGQMKDLVKGDSASRLNKARSLVRHSGVIAEGPPRHPNCRCWLLPVVSETALREQIRQGFGHFGDEIVDELKAWEPKVVIFST